LLLWKIHTYDLIILSPFFTVKFISSRAIFKPPGKYPIFKTLHRRDSLLIDFSKGGNDFATLWG